MEKQTIAIYSRKSRFTGKGESIENQIELCRQYIGAHEGADAARSAVVYEDEGFSGGNLERPQFKRMMDDAKAGKFFAVVVYRLDRISRNIGDFAALIEEFNALGISFVSIKEQFDTSSPMGRAMMYIASVFSQLERETIAERIRDNMRELAKTGRWLGGVTPTGYASEQVQRVTVDGKVRKACKLKTIPEEAEVIRLIFDKFLETNSLTKTDVLLLQNGYVTKNGKAFTRFAIKGILTNPVYMIADEDAYRYLTRRGAELFSQPGEFDGKYGIMAYNRTMQKAGKAAKIRPMPEWIVSVGRHRGLISGARWVRTQEMLEQNRSKAYRRPRSHVALLSGVLLCGGCGGYMRPKLTGRENAQEEQLYTYLCAMKERSRSCCCSVKNAGGNALDRAVAQGIGKLSGDGGEFVRRLEKGKKALLENREGGGEQIGKLNGSLEENEREIKALVAAVPKAAGTAAEEYVMRRIEELHDRGESLRRRIAEMRRLAEDSELPKLELDGLCRTLRSFGSVFDSMTVEQKRAAIRACVNNVTWDGEEAHVYLLGSENAEPSERPAPTGNGKEGGLEPPREDSK